MQGGAIGSMGKARGYHLYNEAQRDTEIKVFGERCYAEAIFGICGLFGMSEEDLQKGIRKKAKLVPGATERKTTDSIDRQMFGLSRKLGREERLIGPAMACLQSGKLPFFLAKAAAYAFDFNNPNDPKSVEVIDFVQEHGIQKAVEKYCGLDPADAQEGILLQLICGHYTELHGR